LDINEKLEKYKHILKEIKDEQNKDEQKDKNEKKDNDLKRIVQIK
jgi:hypothetical protein